MPVIHIHMTAENGGLSVEKRQELCREITKTFASVVGRGEKSAVVIIDEVSVDNYAIGGKTIREIRKKS